MWELFVHSSNLVFSVSLCLMLLLGLFECLLLFVGSSTQGFLDQFIPDQLLEPQHSNLNMPSETHFLIQFLDWLYIGRVPVLIWLIIFLTLYGLLGLFIQAIYALFSHNYFPLWLITPACFILVMPLVRVSAICISKILPKDESTAITLDELIGRTATIILGDAKINYPAQAKVKDHFGQTHYILVEPETNILFHQGQQVLLTDKTKIGFRAISISIT